MIGIPQAVEVLCFDHTLLIDIFEERNGKDSKKTAFIQMH